MCRSHPRSPRWAIVRSRGDVPAQPPLPLTADQVVKADGGSVLLPVRGTQSPERAQCFRGAVRAGPNPSRPQLRGEVSAKGPAPRGRSWEASVWGQLGRGVGHSPERTLLCGGWLPPAEGRGGFGRFIQIRAPERQKRNACDERCGRTRAVSRPLSLWNLHFCDLGTKAAPPKSCLPDEPPVCVCMRVHAYICVPVHVCVYACPHMSVHVCMHMCTCVCVCGGAVFSSSRHH